MPKIIVKEFFKFAHHGYQIEEFEPSPEPRETTDEVADLAVKERWAKRVKDTVENKDAAQLKEGEAVQTSATADAAAENAATQPTETRAAE
ncbi:MAG: hypothetical protein K2Q07_01395 [Burkholderiaceae bacterium]|nr:hypothetical protein [Burkholderiaceae bacterium]MBY0467612.1 hypothetical protein [Burkholderiaceae bacterium]